MWLYYNNKLGMSNNLFYKKNKLVKLYSGKKYLINVNTYFLYNLLPQYNFFFLLKKNFRLVTIVVKLFMYYRYMQIIKNLMWTIYKSLDSFFFTLKNNALVVNKNIFVFSDIYLFNFICRVWMRHGLLLKQQNQLLLAWTSQSSSRNNYTFWEAIVKFSVNNQVFTSILELQQQETDTDQNNALLSQSTNVAVVDNFGIEGLENTIESNNDKLVITNTDIYLNINNCYLDDFFLQLLALPNISNINDYETCYYTAAVDISHDADINKTNIGLSNNIDNLLKIEELFEVDVYDNTIDIVVWPNFLVYFLIEINYYKNFFFTNISNITEIPWVPNNYYLGIRDYINYYSILDEGSRASNAIEIKDTFTLTHVPYCYLFNKFNVIPAYDSTNKSIFSIQNKELLLWKKDFFWSYIYPYFSYYCFFKIGGNNDYFSLKNFNVTSSFYMANTNFLSLTVLIVSGLTIFNSLTSYIRKNFCKQHFKQLLVCFFSYFSLNIFENTQLYFTNTTLHYIEKISYNSPVELLTMVAKRIPQIFRLQFFLFSRRVRKMLKNKQKKYRRVFCYILPYFRLRTLARFLYSFFLFSTQRGYGNRIYNILGEILYYPKTSAAVALYQKQQISVLSVFLKTNTDII